MKSSNEQSIPKKIYGFVVAACSGLTPNKNIYYISYEKDILEYIGKLENIKAGFLDIVDDEIYFLVDRSSDYILHKRPVYTIKDHEGKDITTFTLSPQYENNSIYVTDIIKLKDKNEFLITSMEDEWQNPIYKVKRLGKNGILSDVSIKIPYFIPDHFLRENKDIYLLAEYSLTPRNRPSHYDRIFKYNEKSDTFEESLDLKEIYPPAVIWRANIMVVSGKRYLMYFKYDELRKEKYLVIKDEDGNLHSNINADGLNPITESHILYAFDYNHFLFAISKFGDNKIEIYECKENKIMLKDKIGVPDEYIQHFKPNRSQKLHKKLIEMQKIKG